MLKESSSTPPTALARLQVAADRTLIMGVLNVTPDSFSDGGLWNAPEDAILHGVRMWRAGADIIDVGGESTRPRGHHYGEGAERVQWEAEAERIIPVIEGLGKEGVPCISIDTWKHGVARAALDSGAHLVNDVSGLSMDAELGPLVAQAGCPIVLMHMRGTPETTMTFADDFGDVVEDVCSELEEAVQRALASGISRDAILLDPGLGFGKKGRDNFSLMSGVPALRKLGFPLLLGASRKSFLGDVTGRKRPMDRDWATAATVAAAVLSRVEVVRVHHVEAMVDVAKVAQELYDVSRHQWVA